MDLAITRTSPHDFDATIEKVTATLMEQGFGVLTTIDMQGKMQEKLDRTMGRFTILGACNPALAWDAVHAVPQIGVLLPCNVVVREEDDAVIVEAMNPEAALGLIPNDDVHAVAQEATKRLRAAVAAV